MTSYLLAGPATEPVSLAEAKAFLKVDEAAEDGLITTLVGAARLHVEGVTGRALVAQSWRLVLDAWPEGDALRLPVAPLLSLTAVTAIDGDGASHALPLEQFRTEPERLLLPGAVVGLPELQSRHGIEIDYVAGYGTAASAVPADLRQAVLGLVGHWFEHRDAVIVAGSGAIVPSGLDLTLTPYRRVRL